MVVGELKGLGRIRFHGTLLPIAHSSGVRRFMSRISLLLKDFKGFFEERAARLVGGCRSRTARDREDIPVRPPRGQGGPGLGAGAHGRRSDWDALLSSLLRSASPGHAMLVSDSPSVMRFPGKLRPTGPAVRDEDKPLCGDGERAEAGHRGAQRLKC